MLGKYHLFWGWWWKGTAQLALFVSSRRAILPSFLQMLAWQGAIQCSTLWTLAVRTLLIRHSLMKLQPPFIAQQLVDYSMQLVQPDLTYQQPVAFFPGT
jgi:hypothetical protein